VRRERLLNVATGSLDVAVELAELVLPLLEFLEER
jgi:hypothetical protein